MTDEAEAITHKYSYSPYGVIWESDVTDFNAFTFNGKHGVMMEDEEFYFMRRRFYKADEGRFISQDPVWSTNLYVFGGNNPVMNIDPSGRFWDIILDGLFIVIDIVDIGYQYVSYGEVDPISYASLSADAGAALIPGVTGAGLAVRAGNTTIKATSTATKVLKTAGKVKVENARIIDRVNGIDEIRNVDVTNTINRIKSGGKNPHKNDGTIFKNRENRLPTQQPGYYKEYVHPTNGIKGAGAQRIIKGNDGSMWYSPDHYRTFIQIK
ncbi:MAG: RHS repeat-associated core domain-containing protein [Lewinella sp.]|uniref:RHS repeat-associated core domain-containing protein n=1 Tax=Lewinella sp. TaxID=2004506 RepID=UPI003D6B80C3